MLWHAAGVWVKGGSPPRQPSDTAWESYPDAVPPTRAVRPSPTLCGSCAGRPVSTPRHCAVHSYTASTSHPSKEDGGTLKKRTTAYSAPAWNDTVTSGQQGASPPSSPAIPGTAASPSAVGTQKDGTPPHSSLYSLRSSVSPTLEPTYG
jgi:hypothetical protein